ncbi:uncharacterized protein LOC113766429 [Coffea eugenioides]|uniref:uncharacterized protein LOC113766429 n=1 Tax=Coffea eugenioides TaxID=49369 RepID=UPI000F5CDAD0|nr:uncharacterized protein LOC113737557 [Coffea arabica]XP_027166424.1 uncharacterized protein LOC113766429 [Coffea eugenioides]
MTTPPFMPPPFLDIVIAVIFGKAGGEGGIRDVVMGAGDATKSGGGFNKDGAWEEASGGRGGNAGEEGPVSGDFIVGGGEETEVGGDGAASGKRGKGERAGEGGAVPKGGKGDPWEGGGGDKFTDGGGQWWWRW